MCRSWCPVLLCVLNTVYVCRLCSYGLGILLRTYSWDDLRTSGPWLLGSLGVVVLDVLISLQVLPNQPLHHHSINA